eukprot:scaffold90185_cov31-Tisochrysis_lutea.AAC.2
MRAVTKRGFPSARLGYLPKASVHGEGGSSIGSASMCQLKAPSPSAAVGAFAAICVIDPPKQASLIRLTMMGVAELATSAGGRPTWGVVLVAKPFERFGAKANAPGGVGGVPLQVGRSFLVRHIGQPTAQPHPRVGALLGMPRLAATRQPQALCADGGEQPFSQTLIDETVNRDYFAHIEPRVRSVGHVPSIDRGVHHLDGPPGIPPAVTSDRLVAGGEHGQWHTQSPLGHVSCSSRIQYPWQSLGAHARIWSGAASAHHHPLGLDEVERLTHGADEVLR